MKKRQKKKAISKCANLNKPLDIALIYGDIKEYERIHQCICDVGLKGEKGI